jgi:serine/threonine protein kinase/tetratricopeptide (TPR) repeat protein
MNPDLEKLFDQAVSLVGAEREEFIARHCPDPELRRELETLLASDQGAGTFLQGAVMEAASSVVQDLAFSPGQRLGRYRVLSMIGQGGMGLVYLAERADGKLEQRVALKVLQSGPGQPFVAEQLQRECHILASLEHPNIARVLDADITENGQPYFVMEYVDGQPIDRYCDDRKLSVRDRLRVLLPVCDAVHVAHQKLIVHRDLKPDNILVTRQGVPKLLDFGIAKVLSEVPAGQQNTATRIMTPEYASPEQASGEPVTTATDIYSLGGVLYKMLTGKAPHQFADKSPLAMARAVSDAEVRKPSELRHELAGDTDSILLMALQKEPARRYRSVDHFAADLERLLERKPVMARPDTVWYRTRKYVRRHFLAVGMSAAIVLLLGVFSVLQAVQLRRITRERDRANRVTDFMTNMFRVSDPSQHGGNKVTAREILDKASGDIGKNLTQDPEVQSQMMRIMGLTYENLGLYGPAHELTKRALDTRMKLYGPDDRMTLETMNQLSAILFREGHFAAAEKLQRQALTSERRVFGPDDPLTARTMERLAEVLEREGHLDEAEKLARESIEIASRTKGPESDQTLRSINALGQVLYEEGRYAEAEQQLRNLLELRRRILGPDNSDTLAAMSNLAIQVMAQGRSAEAEQLYRELLAANQRVLGPDHPDTASAINNLGEIVCPEGRIDECEKLRREALRIRLLSLGPEHPDTLVSQYNLADLLFSRGQIREAEELQRQTLATQIRVLGPEAPDTLASQSDLAKTLIREGRYNEAEEIARKTLDVQLRKLGPEHPDTMDTLKELGRALGYTHRYAEADKLFHNVIAQQDASKGKGNAFSVWYSYACVAVAANRPDDALQFLQEAIHHGYKDADAMMADDDLKNLRPNGKFQQLVTELKHASAKVQAP